MVVLGPSPGGWRWQSWWSVEIYVLMALHRWENSFCLAAFTVVTALFFSYMNTTNCSIFSNASCHRFAFSVPTSKKANATVGNAVHVFQAFSFSVPAKEWDRVTISYSVKGRQSSWFVWTKTWSNRVGCSVSEMFSSPKCNPQLLHLYLFNNRDCKYNNVSVSSSYYYLLLHHEEILVCRPFRGFIHSHGSGLFLWMMRPRCHRKWKRVLCVKLDYYYFFNSISLKRKTNRSLFSHRCSRSSSRWKVMMPKVTSYDVDHGPVCFLSRPSSCLRDKRPKQYPTIEYSEVVQKCKARRRCCCSPGKCLMSWGRAIEQQMHRQGSSHLLHVSGLQQCMHPVSYTHLTLPTNHRV